MEFREGEVLEREVSLPSGLQHPLTKAPPSFRPPSRCTTRWGGKRLLAAWFESIPVCLDKLEEA